MPIECPKTINIVPEADLFSFDFAINMGGNDSTNINYSTQSITLSTKHFKYDILQIKTENDGINDRISKHWPNIKTWLSKTITKKIKIFGKTTAIPFHFPHPTQAYYEVYTKKETAKLTFFTIPSFKFQLDSNLLWSGDIGCNFTLSVENKAIPGGVFLLSTATAGLIDTFYNDGIEISSMQNSTDRTTRIKTMLNDSKFYEYASATTLLAYFMKEGLCASFTINNASGNLKWNLDKFYMEFGDLKINIPKFTIELPFPNIVKEHPITVTGSPEFGLMVSVELIRIPGDKTFLDLMIDGLQSTLDAANNLIGTDKYDAAYVKELNDILNQLRDDTDSVTKWIQNYLGISYTTIISFVFCPEGMTNVPPTPFYLKVELDLNVNPYKILNDLFNAAEAIEKTMATFENDLLKAVKDIGPSFAHPIEHMIKGALNTLNKELQSATAKGQKLINNKYLNKVYTPHIITYVPVELPP